MKKVTLYLNLTVSIELPEDTLEDDAFDLALDLWDDHVDYTKNIEFLDEDTIDYKIEGFDNV